MADAPQYLSEFVCGSCGHTGHVTWEGEGTGKRVVEKTEIAETTAGGVQVFSCAHCGTRLNAV